MSCSDCGQQWHGSQAHGEQPGTYVVGRLRDVAESRRWQHRSDLLSNVDIGHDGELCGDEGGRMKW